MATVQVPDAVPGCQPGLKYAYSFILKVQYKFEYEQWKNNGRRNL